ncbi:MAG: hypothetical protein GY852_07620 [bacterium]|nr:hypothetical protein [bacterium]
MKKLLIALILCAALFAAGIEDTIAGYYAASKSENIEEFMSYVDTSDLDASEIEYEREMMLGIWEAYDTEEYHIRGLEYSTDTSGEYAMAGYSLNATISGAENFDYELDYVMLLHSVGGNWKVSYVMPYEEYVNMSEQSRDLMAIDYLSEEEYELGSAPLEPADPTFDGKPPEDLSAEIASASGTSTGGTQQCRDTWDCDWDETCEKGVCVPAPQDGCGTAFVLIGLGAILFARKG